MTHTHDLPEVGRDDWVAQLDKEAHSDPNRHRDGISDCKDLENDKCDPLGGNQCSDFFDGNWASKRAYWVFKAVKGAHGTIRAMHSKLDGETLSQSLKLKAMIEDFDVSSGDDMSCSIGALLSGGLAMASSVAGTVGHQASGMGMGIMSTILGSLGSGGGPGEGEAIKLSAVEEQLGKVFDSWKEGLEKVMALVMGDGDSSDYDDLPSFTNRAVGEPIAKFFGTPFWLLDSDSDLVENIIADVGTNIQHKMVDIILQTGNWKLVANPQIKSHEECYKVDHRRWIDADGEHMCFSIYDRGDVHDSRVPETMDKYGIDSLQNYFEIAIDCARNGDSEKNTIDAGDTINADGDKPRCFYSIPVKKRVGATGGSGGGGLLGDNVKGYELEDLF